MVKTVIAAITATVLLVSAVAPSSAQYYRRGGGYGGGGWNGGNGAALGLGLGLGLLGGALATAPYYAAPYYAAPGYGYAPCSSRPHRLVLVRSIRQYYPYSAITPMCSYVPDSMATTGGPVNNLNQHPSKSE